MDYLQIIREKLILWCWWAAHVYFGLNALAYLACCVVAGGPVGPVAYIGWLYHCCQWGVT
jgi:hypothetical protein